MWESLKAYLRAMFLGWAGLVGTATGVLAVVFGVVPHLRLGLWIWIGLTAIAYSLAAFLAFHHEREKGPDVAGALSLTGLWFEVYPGAQTVMQVSLTLRNTWDKQIRFRVTSYSQEVNSVRESNNSNVLERYEWLGREQDMTYRLPVVTVPQPTPVATGGIVPPGATIFTGSLDYAIVYENPRATHYEHRTARSLSFTVWVDMSQPVPVRWTYGLLTPGEEETRRLSRQQVRYKELERSSWG